MRLDEFIEKTGIPIARLADRCSCTAYQIHHILRGGNPTLKTAITIKNYTKGEVQAEDLLPMGVLDAINEGRRKSVKACVLDDIN